MPLAIILGLILLSPSSEASIACSMSPMGVEQITPSPLQNSETGNSALQNPSTQPGEQQESPAQPAQAPQSSVQPCPGNSQPTGTKSDCKPAASKPKKHHQTHKAVAPAATPAPEGPAKTVVRNGSAADPTVDLSPAPSPQEASRLETYNRLVTTTDANLQKLSGRQLSPAEEDTVKQIKSYMEQAKGAAKDGDVQRAYNLAVKANLLSAELAEH